MIKIFSSALCLCVSMLSCAAYAQASESTAPVDAVPPEPETTNIKRQLASEIVALISGIKNTDAALDDITEPWVQQMLLRKFEKRGLSDIQKKNPEYFRKVSAAMTPIVRDAFVQTYPALREEQIDIWTKNMDEATLGKIKRLFSTNLFKKMAAIVHNPANADFSLEGQLEAKLAALNSITKEDIAEIESHSDCDDAMAVKMEQTLTAWTARLDSWKAELIEKLDAPIKAAIDQIEPANGDIPSQ